MLTPHRPPRLIPDKHRFLCLEGVEYFIPWEDLHSGCSFFLKTLATPVQVRAALRPSAAFMQMNLKVASRVEFGRYGVRVWRV